MDEDPNWATSSYVCIWIGGRPVFFWSCLYIPIHITANVSWLRLDALGRSLPHCTLASLYPGIFGNCLCQRLEGRWLGEGRQLNPATPRNAFSQNQESRAGDRGRGASSPGFGVPGTYPFNPSHPRKPFCVNKVKLSPHLELTHNNMPQLFSAWQAPVQSMCVPWNVRSSRPPVTPAGALTI